MCELIDAGGRRLHKPRWVDLCDYCIGYDCVCGRQSEIVMGCECSQNREELIMILKMLGIDKPERFKGIFQQEHKPCAACTKYIYDSVKREKAKRSLLRPRPGAKVDLLSSESDSAVDSSSENPNAGKKSVEDTVVSQERTTSKLRTKQAIEIDAAIAKRSSVKPRRRQPATSTQKKKKKVSSSDALVTKPRELALADYMPEPKYHFYSEQCVDNVFVSPCYVHPYMCMYWPLVCF